MRHARCDDAVHSVYKVYKTVYCQYGLFMRVYRQLVNSASRNLDSVTKRAAAVFYGSIVASIVFVPLLSSLGRRLTPDRSSSVARWIPTLYVRRSW